MTIAAPTPTVELDPLAVALSISVPGEPISKGRPRVVRSARGSGRPITYTPQATAAQEQLVALYARQGMAGRDRDEASAFGVSLTFHLRTRVRRDIDNLSKLILDALNGIVWGDDSQVEELHARLVRGAADPRTGILVYRIAAGRSC